MSLSSLKSVRYSKVWHIPEEWNLQQNLFCWKGFWQWRVICKENWKNSTKNISMGLHEVKWEEEKITNFTLLKLCTHNWRTECTKGSRFLSCSKEYVWKFAKKFVFEIEKYVSKKISQLETVNFGSKHPRQIWKYRCMNRWTN